MGQGVVRKDEIGLFVIVGGYIARPYIRPEDQPTHAEGFMANIADGDYVRMVGNGMGAELKLGNTSSFENGQFVKKSHIGGTSMARLRDPDTGKAEIWFIQRELPETTKKSVAQQVKAILQGGLENNGNSQAVGGSLL
jgi:hypothetical protein